MITWRTRMIRGVDYINKQNGFSITGWVRRGKVVDESASGGPAQASATQKNYIQSSELKIHITSITVNKDKDGNELDLKDFLFDLASVTIADGGPIV